jgi:hypothetical protein
VCTAAASGATPAAPGHAAASAACVFRAATRGHACGTEAPPAGFAAREPPERLIDPLSGLHTIDLVRHCARISKLMLPHLRGQGVAWAQVQEAATLLQVFLDDLGASSRS